MQKITPFLWFDSNASDAVKFYCSVFSKSYVGAVTHYSEEASNATGQPQGSVMTVAFTLMGQEFSAMNAGPVFAFNPSISFFVRCKTKEDVDSLFKKLSSKGKIMMPLDKYPFSQRYAFFKDKYGVSWQVMVSDKSHISPSLLFVDSMCGKAEEAVQWYTSIFKGKITHVEKYAKGEPGKEGTVKFSSFELFGQEFTAMDAPGTHKFSFNESISFLVNCETQKEIDHYWSVLIKGGAESQCGWLKDKFGVSWQIVPADLAKMMSDPGKVKRVMAEIMTMRKLDMARMRKAAQGK